MTGLNIVPMAVSYLEDIAAIETRISDHPWSLQQFEESLATHQCWVLLDDLEVVGYAILSVAVPGSNGEAELLNLAIHPNYQRRGMGGKLLQHCIETLHGCAARLFLEVRVSNFPAIHLYLHQGFEEVGQRRDYYRLANGATEDALVMMKIL